MKLSVMLLSVFTLGDGSFCGCQGTATVSDMSHMMVIGASTKVREYEMLYGELPPMEEGLNALVTRPKALAEGAHWAQLYDEVPMDPWDNPIFYFIDDELPNGFGVYSCGPDGISKSEGNDPDDINSWD
ncbi:MAG: type II secretion system protein GspG [Roseibacillus sp.]